MFAKVFGQIFDSSIAEDYNCRRMFMDLLVLADQDGVVDMTHEAISRRTNVPIEEVQRYILELQQPDPKSRSKMEEGKRIVAISIHRDWGWKIVNYHHYRKIRDDEVRRQYFRDKMRQYRALKRRVKDKGLTDVNAIEPKVTPLNNLQPPASASASTSSDKVGSGNKVGSLSKCSEEEAISYVVERGLKKEDGEWFYDKCVGCGWKNNGKAILDWKATVRAWSKINVFPSQKAVKQLSLIPECLKMPNPRDWQEAKRIVRHLRSKENEYPAFQKQINDRIEALRSQFKLEPM